MLWDFGEANLLHDSSGGFLTNIVGSTRAFESFSDKSTAGHSELMDAASQSLSRDKVISTDPPYYDNVPYADLSDFFYIWLRRSLRSVFPDLFATLAVPKAEELVAFAYRHGSKVEAEKFFLDGMTQAMHRLAEQAHPAFPVTIYYAFKQSESRASAGTASSGWETFLDAVIRAGFAVTGTPSPPSASGPRSPPRMVRPHHAGDDRRRAVLRRAEGLVGVRRGEQAGKVGHGDFPRGAESTKA